MLLADLVATSTAVASTRSRTEKTRIVAEALDRARPEERELVAHYLAGRLPQRRTGLGWRGLQELPPPAGDGGPTLTVAAVDAALSALAALAGSGSASARAEATRELFGRATADEQRWLRSLILGEVRQGASDAVLGEALALAAGRPIADVRRAAMLAGGVPAVVAAAYADTLAEVGLEVGRAILPMLASSAGDLDAAWAKLSATGDGQVAVDTKLDGIRIQVHRDGDDVRVASRSLDDLTERLPEVVALARRLPAERLVLDGEALLVGPDGRPRPFQETASETARQGSRAGVAPYFFDLLHRDGRDLLDAPAAERWAELAAVVPADLIVPRWQGSDPAEAADFAARALSQGHEGVVLKDPGAAYAAGRRGSSWIKVKPVHTLDLVVLAVEWGSGRRRGWLSNIHLGARDGDDFVMVGKTFKGMTDEILRWQTERFTELETRREGHVVHVRPEQVVEIALDGVQRSSRYPGGVALRFARVVGYRHDKSAAEADTIDAVRALR